ncbi:GxxExxY protein [Ferruginibacter sp. HRS2-29]|nr:GxxExxY protein [Ferruginibacter sp. HRS2-29]
MNRKFLPLSAQENLLAKQAIDIAFKIHSYLGPGLLESVYETCFCHELSSRNIPFVRQKIVPIKYEGLLIENALKIDLLMDDKLIIELKAQAIYHPVWEAQLLSYLRLSEKRIGYIINFHTAFMKDGFKRFVF